MIKKRGACPGCGEVILWIKCTDRRTYQAEDEPVYIRECSGGETFITALGQFVYGEMVGDAYDSGPVTVCHVPHKGKCPQGGRKRRRV